MTDAPYAADERTMLVTYLQRQRDLVTWKVNGLSDDRARAVTTASGLTVHGIVRHLAQVERYWLRRWFAGQRGSDPNSDSDALEGDMCVPPDVALADLVADYLEESRHCDAVVCRTHSLDDPRSLDHARWIRHHLIKKASRHLGHLDLLCELVDGRTGEEP